MFIGTTPNEIKILLQDILKNRSKEDIYVGCSGNFSTDKVLAGMGFKVHSNDVSLYSKLIADILLGTDTEIKVLNDDLINVFSQWKDSEFKKLVQVMFAMRLSEFEPRKNEYQKEFYNNYLTNSGIYYEQTCAKIIKAKQFDFQIDSFCYGDFIEHLKTKNPNSVGVAFPPTYKGGYEKLFQFTENSFEYERAKYDLFDPKQAQYIFKDLLDTGDNIIYSDREHEVLKEYEVAKAVLGHGKNTVYIYSSLDNSKKYYIERKSTGLCSKYKVIDTNKEFTQDTKITVESCQLKDVNYFKAFYMSSRVDYSEGGDFALVFLADGEAFGFVSFNKRLSTFTELFIHSDFVVNSHIKKLSKLLIILLKSKEVKNLLLRFYKHYYKGLRTSVYTEKPVSMKYRGVFELEKREKEKKKLIYKAEFSNQTINEIFTTWLSKYKEQK